jgi:hypothetical protein
MDIRRKVFGEAIGLPTGNDFSTDQIKAILFAPHCPGQQSPHMPDYNRNDFKGTPDGLQIPHSFEIVKDKFEKVFLDDNVPMEAASGVWINNQTTANALILSLFTQNQMKVHKLQNSKKLFHFPFSQPHVNSRPMVCPGRVDSSTGFSGQFTERCDREDGLVPVALGLVEESNSFSSSTGAAVLPYHPTEEEELSEKDMRIQAIDVPAECHFLGTQNNKYACSLRLSDVEDCWNKIVSDDTKIESLLPNGIWKTEQETVSAATCLLLNGVYMRYDGLRDTSCWAKLFQRLLHVGKIKDMHMVTAQDFSIESPWDLCHLTYLLFDLVIDMVSLGVIDGLLRTLVARMIATWREQQRQIHPVSTPLKYPLDLFPIGLASVAKAITIDVFNVKGRSELLDAKHGQLLRDRSHGINADSDAGTARGMRDNLMALINWCQQEDRQILKVGCGIKKKDLASAFLGIRNKAIEHLRHNPDVHTKVNELEDWRELLMSKYMIRNMYSLLGSFPGRSHKASNMMCTLSTLCLNRKCLNILLTFVQLNGCGSNCPADKTFNVSHIKDGIWSSIANAFLTFFMFSNNPRVF